MQVESVVAPFVMKTYKMVNEPSTDAVICWGRESNSFVVADPFAFSQTLLPAHFKHNNFSSFVRQLNTYGFRKVDPDRWEFAHAFFLRGQTHLLQQVVRRKTGHSSSNSNRKIKEGMVDEVDDSVVLEVLKLKQDQQSIDEKVQRMRRRLQETEQKPKQMLAFLVKVLGDPQLLQSQMERGDEEEEENGIKRPRIKLELDDEGNIDDMLALGFEGLVQGAEGVFLGSNNLVPSIGPVGFDAGDVFGVETMDLGLLQ